MTHAPPPASALERYLAFAFAGADLLVEVDASDRIVFAEGAFQSRFGEDGGHFAGDPLSRLVASDQHASLADAMAMLRHRGRLPPTPLNLADRARTPVLLAGLARAGQGAALTFGPVPEGLVLGRADRRPGEMLRAIEARLRARDGGTLTLVEATGLDGDAEAATDAVLKALAELAPGALPDRLGDGRFGVLTETAPDEAKTREQAQEALAAAGISGGSVEVSKVSLAAGSLTPLQAVCAVRLALGRFASQGKAGLDAMGPAADLAELISSATQRAAAMRGAIMARRFSLMYQPIVDLTDRAIHHHEALLRPDACEGASPAEFVATAEAVGLSEELDLTVATVAAEALLADPQARVGVNISGQSLGSVPFLDRLLRLCRLSRDLRGRLSFELTETAEVDRAEAVGRAIAKLRAEGHPVALDDVGAGHAGFGHLQRFPVDFIKIDGHYVQAAGASPRDHAILGSIVDLGHRLHCKVIAERIETEAEAAMLTELGVEYGQGWLFGRPGRSLARG